MTIKNSKTEKVIGAVLVILVGAYVLIPKSWLSDSTSELIALALIVLLFSYMVYLTLTK